MGKLEREKSRKLKKISFWGVTLLSGKRKALLGCKEGRKIFSNPEGGRTTPLSEETQNGQGWCLLRI